jgi:hypothetical protein
MRTGFWTSTAARTLPPSATRRPPAPAALRHITRLSAEASRWPPLALGAVVSHGRRLLRQAPLAAPDSAVLAYPGRSAAHWESCAVAHRPMWLSACRCRAWAARRFGARIGRPSRCPAAPLARPSAFVRRCQHAAMMGSIAAPAGGLAGEEAALVYAPFFVDVSLRPGWFWKVRHSLAALRTLRAASSA